jgi:hypothetical protein
MPESILNPWKHSRTLILKAERLYQFMVFCLMSMMALVGGFHGGIIGFEMAFQLPELKSLNIN